MSEFFWLNEALNFDANAFDFNTASNTYGRFTSLSLDLVTISIRLQLSNLEKQSECNEAMELDKINC